MSTPDSQPPSPRKPVRRRPVEFQPLAERMRILTWAQRLRRDLSTGSVGFVVSLALHALLLIILAMILFTPHTIGDGDPILASWLIPGEKTTAPGRKIKPIAIPINIGDVPKVATTTPQPANDAGDPDSDVKPGVVPVDVSTALELRNPRQRQANLERLGGTPDTERAIKQGLMWLSRQQQSDGRWELHQGYPNAGFSWTRTDTGATALALLAFLGHGNTHRDGEYASVVSKGLTWLQRMQDPETGDFHDLRREEGREGAFYAHSMATMAICEALALTQDAELRPAAERGVKYLLFAQHPDHGGWKFRPISKLMVGDLAVTGWALMGLHTARMAGIEIPQSDFVRASSFLDSVKVKGLPRYKFEPISPDSHATAAMTAEALLCRQWFGWPRNFPEMEQGVRYITADDQRPSWSEGKRNIFRWYFTSQVLHNLGGDDWKNWNSAVREAIVRNQITGGTAKPPMDVRGSWNPTSPTGDPREFAEKGGRLYMTAMCILILETPYRHQPLYHEQVANRP